MTRSKLLFVLRAFLIVLVVLPPCLEGSGGEKGESKMSPLFMSVLRLGGYKDQKATVVVAPTKNGTSFHEVLLRTLRQDTEEHARRFLHSLTIVKQRAHYGWDWVLHVPSHPLWSKPCPGALKGDTRPCLGTIMAAIRARVEALKAAMLRLKPSFQFQPAAHAFAQRVNHYGSLTKAAFRRATARMVEGLSLLTRVILAMSRTLLTAAPFVIDTRGLEGFPGHMVDQGHRGMTPGLSTKGSSAAWRAMDEISSSSEAVTRRASLLSSYRDRTFRVVYVISSRGKKRGAQAEPTNSNKGSVPAPKGKGPTSLEEKVSVLDDWKRQHAQEVESGLRRRDGEMLTHAFSFLGRLMGQYPDAEDVEMTIEETANTPGRWEDSILFLTFFTGTMVAAVIVVLGWKLESLRLTPLLEGDLDNTTTTITIASGPTTTTTKGQEGEDEDGFHILPPASGDPLPGNRFVYEDVSDEEEEEDDIEVVDPSSSMMDDDTYRKTGTQ